MKRSEPDSTTRSSGDVWLSCPTCRRSECFNAEEPIIDLSMCHLLRMMESVKQLNADCKEQQMLLQNRLDNANKVEITGPKGKPVYATGSFQNGSWFSPALWNVQLQMQQDKVVPVSALDNIEIRLGGVLFTSSLDQVSAQMDEQNWDGATRKEVLCHFGVGTEHGLWLPIKVSGWDREHWFHLKEQDFASRHMNEDDQVDVYGTICDEIPRLFPAASVSFASVHFFKDGVDQVIANLGLPDKTEEEIQEEKLICDMYAETAASFQKLGCNEYGSSFMKRMTEVQLVASLLNLWSMEHLREVKFLIYVNVNHPHPETTEDYVTRVMKYFGVPIDRDSINALCNGIVQSCSEMEQRGGLDGETVDGLCSGFGACSLSKG